MTRTTLVLLSLLLFAPAVQAKEDFRASAQRQLSTAFERAGRRPPQPDTGLETAARSLAGAVLNHGAQAVGDPRRVSAEVSRAGASDPHPRALLVRAGSPESALAELLRHPGLTNEAATHLGLATAQEGTSTALVALLSVRKAALDPFPRHLSGTGSRKLCGRLEDGLSHAEVVVTRPAGHVDRIVTMRPRTRDFCANLPFDVAGTHSVEVMARGERGPLVAALFDVEIGARSVALGGPAESEPEPADDASARVQILERINVLRTAQGAPPLVQDPHLERLAQDYSERMVREGFFAHVSPDGKTLRGRLREEGYVFLKAGENLGAAEGPLAAHRSIEDSPAHRHNLLRKDFNRVGLGMAMRDRPGGGREVVLTELFAAVSPQANPSPAGDGVRGRYSTGPEPAAINANDPYALVNQRRREAKVPDLKRNQVLEQLAKDHAARALALQSPSTELEGSELHQRVFEALPGAGKVAIDIYLADDEHQLPASSNLSNRTWKQIGIGVVRGNSHRFGRELAWVVMVYASGR